MTGKLGKFMGKKIKVTLNHLSTNGLWFIPLFSLKVKKKSNDSITRLKLKLSVQYQKIKT